MEYWSQVIKSQRARKSLSALNVFGLSVCVGAALLIMLYVRFELSFDSFHDGIASTVWRAVFMKGQP